MDEMEIRVIELDMMDKRKLIPLTLASGFCVRGLLYPVNLIKTRLQIQISQTVYKGTTDAFIKIAHKEGFFGLYRGFGVNCAQLFPGICYIMTYESVRAKLKEYSVFENSTMKSLVAGFCASLVGQTLSVPLDIVIQHIMLLGQQKSDGSKTHVPILKKLDTQNKPFGTAFSVVREVYKGNGVKGFYKGYFVSLSVFAPNSALFWYFYETYLHFGLDVVPSEFPRLLVQCAAAPLAGISAAIITNPLDLIRARMQVYQTSFQRTCSLLWQEERLRMIVKGLSARLVQTVLSSLFIILGYESIKRFSLLEEHKHQIKW